MTHEPTAVTTAAPAVRTKGLWKIFEHDGIVVEAVRDVDLTIERGDFVVLAGPSGSGKTTLLNMIGGLSRPSRGRIEVDGRDITDLTESRLARWRLDRVGFVFQAYNLLPVLTALENAEFTMLLRGIPPEERRSRVEELFAEIGMEGLEGRRPGKLSGGQQQRVAIARAVVGEPALVLADEPTANLDSKTSDGLIDLMSRFNRELGTTFIFATHDTELMRRARRFIRLVDGRVVEDERRDAPA
ncbi:MAG: ABC transporter ATP-binding protein [Gemmatimonadota bacterium]|nr:ABC transporter ATP-binding protein [Gemmatimonadota bacterium]